MYFYAVSKWRATFSNKFIREQVLIVSIYSDRFHTDFNQCDERALRNRPNRGNPFYMSIAVHMGQSPAEYDDMQSLFYTMLVLADVELPWRHLILRKQIMEYKQRIKGEVSQLIINTKY